MTIAAKTHFRLRLLWLVLLIIALSLPILVASEGWQADAVQTLREGEGLRLGVYPDPAPPHRPTTGYGHTLLPGEKPAADKATAEAYLRADFLKAQKAAQRTYPTWNKLPDVVKLVVTCAVYQLGEGTYCTFRKHRAYIESENYCLAAKEIENSKWAKQTPRRVKTLANLLRKHSWYL